MFFPGRFQRRFLLSGSVLAVSIFLGGLKGQVFFHSLLHQPAQVVATYGAVLAISNVFVLVGSGLQMLAVGRLARRPLAGPDEDVRVLAELGAAAWACTAALAVAAVPVGVLALTIGEPAQPVAFGWLYLLRMGSALLVPTTALMGGMLVSQAQERVPLRIALENLALTVGAALLLPLTGLTGGGVLIGIGVLGIGIDILSGLRQWLRLGELRPAAATALRTGAVRLCGSSRAVLRGLPQAVAASADGLMITVGAAVIVLCALRTDAQTAAVTAALFAAVRTVVIPLKAFGTVGGRLVLRPPTDPADRPPAGQPPATDQPATDRPGADRLGADWPGGRRAGRDTGVTTSVAVIQAVCWLLVPLGVVLLAAPDLAGRLLGVGAAAGSSTALRLVGCQLLLEPLAGFLSALLKVVTAPGATLPELAISLAGVVLPTVLAATALDLLSLPVIWLAWLAGRLVFTMGVLRAYRRWRAGRPAPADRLTVP